MNAKRRCSDVPLNEILLRMLPLAASSFLPGRYSFLGDIDGYKTHVVKDTLLLYASPRQIKAA